MTPIEIMALILAIVVIVKIVVLLVKPKAWMNIVKPLYRKPAILGIASLILAALSLNYLLKELTIIQIAAAMLFTALLAAITLASYSREVLEFAEKLIDENVVKKAWLSIVIWIALAGWILYLLFV